MLRFTLYLIFNVHPDLLSGAAKLAASVSQITTVQMLSGFQDYHKML